MKAEPDRQENLRVSVLVHGDVLDVEAGLQPVAVTPLRVLGHGRAAEARLVRVRTSDGETITAVEKVFCPGRLTRTVYRLAFQSGFAYRSSTDAIQACFYRRRVAAAVVRVSGEEAQVAAPLYVRWDRESRAMVLGSEYIAGRGIAPPPADLSRMRRWFGQRFGRLIGAASSRKIPATATDEMGELLPQMRRLENALVDAGLTGSGWQVCARAIVSTANLLRIGNSYTIVDLESGIPAVLVPRYLLAAFSLRSVPLFDDLDENRLRSWVDQNGESLRTTMSADQWSQFQSDVDRLIRHNRDWKESEPAILRRPARLLRPRFWRLWKTRILADWQRNERVDERTMAKFRESKRVLGPPHFLAAFFAGCVPGRVGRGAQSLLGNQRDRDHASRILRDHEYRARRIDRYIVSKRVQWKEAQRRPDDSRQPTVAPGQTAPSTRSRERFSIGFLTELVCSKVIPVRWHRWWTDGETRRVSRARLKSLCFDSNYQQEFGRNLVRTRIAAWQSDGRIDREDAASLERQLDTPLVLQYIRAFGIHAGLKLLMPMIWSLKVAALAASVVAGSPLTFLVAMMLLPMLRTAVTIGQIVFGRQPIRDYREALLVGAMPVVGSLAYPIQMYASFPEVSLFLLRDIASRAGRAVPIYGGADSRTELAAIKSVDFVVELLEIWLWILGTRRASPADVIPMPESGSAESERSNDRPSRRRAA